MSTGAIFTGTSKFSSDLSSVLERAISIADLPRRQLEQQRVKLEDKVVAFQSLNARAGALQSTIAGLESGLGASAVTSSVSDGSAVRVTTSPGAGAGTYTMSVQNLGSSTTFVVDGFPTTSNPGAGSYVLTANPTLTFDPDPLDGTPDPVSISLSPASQSLQSLVDEINSRASNYVQAAIVNVGSTATPNYQLSLQSKKLGGADIKLIDGAAVAQNSASERGAMAQYTISGVSVSSDTRSVTIAPNVTVDLIGTSVTNATITLTKNTSSFKAGLSNFIAAFNDMVTEIDSHRGNKTSVLSGDSVLTTTVDSLRSLISTPGASGFGSLNEIGVYFDQKGKLFIEATAFTKATEGKFDQLKNFFGTSSTSGFLKSATNVMKMLTDSEKGFLGSAISTTQSSIDSQDVLIAAQEERITRLTEGMQARLAAADAAIAALESQVTFFKGLFESMNPNNRNR